MNRDGWNNRCKVSDFLPPPLSTPYNALPCLGVAWVEGALGLKEGDCVLANSSPEDEARGWQHTGGLIPPEG